MKHDFSPYLSARGAAVAVAALLPIPACTSKPERRTASSTAEGSSTQPQRPPFAAVYAHEGGSVLVAVVIENVNPKETPRYLEHPSIVALQGAFARYKPERVSLEVEGSPEALTRRVESCEERSFQGPCPDTTYAASLARRQGAVIEVRAPGNAFVSRVPKGGSGAPIGVVLAVFAPDAFARAKAALGAQRGDPRYHVLSERR